MEMSELIFDSQFEQQPHHHRFGVLEPSKFKFEK